MKTIGRSLLALIFTSSWLALAQAPSKPKVVLWDLPDVTTTTQPGIEGSIFAVGDPVHETLTLVALRSAGVVPNPSGLSDKPVAQFVRGVFWNDDPCGQLFLTSSALTPSSGIGWAADFYAADKERAPKSFAILSCKLLGRSHFGDLQFLHGMASADGVPAARTLALVMAWAHFTYDVSNGTVKPSAELSKVPELAGLPSFDAATPKALFKSDNEPALKQRAIASLGHMIQDSYAKGHTLRTTNPDGSAGNIEKFRSYANQNHDKHKKDDMWQGGSSDIDKIRHFPGGSEALAATTKVFEFYQARAPWSEVESYLLQGPFRLAAQTLPSGP